MRPNTFVLMAALLATMAIAEEGLTPEDLRALREELLVNPDFTGKRLMQLRDPLIPMLINELQSDSFSSAGSAAELLTIGVSPFQRGIKIRQSHRGLINNYNLMRPVQRPVDHPRAEAIREAVLKLIRPRYNGGVANRTVELRCLLPLLSEVADDSAAREIASWLQLEEDPHECIFLFRALETIHGLPQHFALPGRCGLMSADEATENARRDKVLCDSEKKRMFTWLNANAERSQSERLANALALWEPRLQPERFNYSERMSEEFNPLIRQGAALIPVIRKRQAQEKSLFVRGQLEVIGASILGEEDKELVRDLIRGSFAERLVALNIVLASGSKAWLQELEDLLRFRGELSENASIVLASCHGKDAIPLLKTARSGNAIHLLKELEERP